MRTPYSRTAAVSCLIASLVVAFVLSACASDGKGTAARTDTRPAADPAATTATCPAARPASGPATRPTTRATTRSTTRPTTRSARRASTRPATGPTTGPTERSAAGVEAPPAPPLSPEAALKTFKLAPGFRIEQVAAEPLIQDPVVIAFDADGRIWAAEMTSYMPDAYGNGEKTPDGKIVILEDADGDGRMDTRSVWLDGLVLPRAVLPLRDGALVGAPPNLWFWRDTDGDGKADTQTLVASDYGNPRQNPEHQANGLLLAMDNWVYSVNYDKRFRWVADEEAAAKGDKGAVKWISSPVPARGQWGQSMDDWGRLYHNSNSDYLRADLVPPHYYAGRNPHYAGRAGVNVQLDKDQTVWPIRPTPAVNRGYRPNFLRPDGSLKEFTAACGPCVYRGGIFPKDCDGNVFVCEPSAHLIRRAKVTEDGLSLSARNAYDKAEFLASTDERFRPVNLNVGPDGALYVVDMYRGILQHVYYLTGYLRELHLRRDMEKPVHMGRIYRVVHESSRLGKFPKLSKLDSEKLIEKLSDPNGWVRDTAQRLLVERQSAEGLRSTLEDLQWSSRTDPRTRAHALWVIEGIGAQLFDHQYAHMAAMDKPPAGVSVAWLRAYESQLGSPQRPNENFLLAGADSLALHDDLRVVAQSAFSLSGVDDERANEAVAYILDEHGDNRIIRDAAISGLGGRELQMIAVLVAEPAEPGLLERIGVLKPEVRKRTPAIEAALAALAGCVIREGKPENVAELLEVAAEQAKAMHWRRVSILSGMAEAVKRTDRKKGVINFESEPQALADLRDSKDPKVRELLAAIEPALHWPGKVDEKQAVAATPLSAEQQKLFDEGKILFGATCAACHQPGGEGLEGKAPPLRDSPWVMGPEGRLIRIVLNGVKGPIHIKDEVINMEMPNLSALDDRQVASILTYARREWGHAGDPVEPEDVAKVRAETKDRADAWTEAELLKVK